MQLVQKSINPRQTLKNICVRVLTHSSNFYNRQVRTFYFFLNVPCKLIKILIYNRRMDYKRKKIKISQVKNWFVSQSGADKQTILKDYPFKPAQKNFRKFISCFISFIFFKEGALNKSQSYKLLRSVTVGKHFLFILVHIWIFI